jgi:type I restriction enzyme S subunit
MNEPYESVAARPTLGLVASHVKRGVTPDYSDEGIAVLSQAVNQASGFDWSRARRLRPKGGDREEASRVRVGDIVVNSTGTGTLGRVGYIGSRVEAVADSHVTLVRVDERLAVPRFVFWALSTVEILRWLNEVLATGATNQIELNPDRLASLRLPHPPLDEQQKIAQFLDSQSETIDALAEKIEQAKNLIRSRFRSALFGAISGGANADLAPSGLAWLPRVDPKWPTAKITRFAQLGTGHTPSRSRPELWRDASIPWITTGEVAQVRFDQVEVIHETREMLSPAGVDASAAVVHPAGTVVLSRTASAGYSAIMGQDMATSQDFVTWTCGPGLLPEYLLWCLRAMRSDLLGRLAQGSTHKTIYFPDIESLKIPVPPVERQAKIVEQVRRFHRFESKAIATYDRLLALLAERRQALITAAVTGQIDVTMESRRVV